MTKGRMDTALSTAPVVTCMKTLMMVFNFIFWVTGIVILAIGIWTKVDLYKYLELSSIYQPEAPYVLIGVGAVIVLIGSLGCCCTIKGHSVLLYMFCGFLFIVFIIELSAGIALLVYRGKLETGFKEGLQSALQLYGTKGNGEITDAVDELQEKLVCCGISSYADWFKTPYAAKAEKEGKSIYSVPESCCRNRHDCVHYGVQTNTTDIHIQGCHMFVVDFINGNMGPIGGVALGISFFQILGAILAFCLAKSINRAKYEQVA
ncbi:tetraspanin-7-like [Biomphalaria glabrata]|uniref:Tetraspanin n=1 Tax=Biomphalaria glabrata TaxID=6526 RepID=A0A9W2YZN6_BIOGL|nr:tetraspanin-7-like [Biomphalaria glabrata]KAI8751492.1 tetraspanin-7-like; partial [Biomphalaria glabrata]